MRSYFEYNNILHQDQNGFREGQSCHLALNTFVDFAKKNLDLKNHVVAVFLDLSKVFDTIDHDLLLLKLERYGFSKSALKLVANYHSNRFSIVCHSGLKSNKESWNLESLKVPYLALYYSLSLLMIYVTYSRNQTNVALQMTQHCLSLERMRMI